MTDTLKDQIARVRALADHAEARGGYSLIFCSGKTLQVSDLRALLDELDRPSPPLDGEGQ